MNHFSCRARGSLRNFCAKRSAGGIVWGGDLERLHLYGDDLGSLECTRAYDAAGRPLEHPAYVEVYSKTYETRPAFLEVKSAVWLHKWVDRGKEGHHVAFMLPEADYQFFTEMAARHLGQNIAYELSFSARDVKPTPDELMGGERLHITDPKDIEIVFSGMLAGDGSGH